MNEQTGTIVAASSEAKPDLAPFFIRGRIVEGEDTLHRSRDLGVTFATPKIDLNSLVHPRTELPPLLKHIPPLIFGPDGRTALSGVALYLDPELGLVIEKEQVS